MVEVYIAFGSNIGDRADNIQKAFASLIEEMEIVKTSALYETKPMYVEEQGYFLNCVAKVECELNLRELLVVLKGVEKKLGRKKVARNGPRIIDLDILFYGNQIVNESDLQIPHPKIAERPFVLVPLAEIAPNFIHPIFKKSIAEMLSELSFDETEIRVQNLRK